MVTGGKKRGTWTVLTPNKHSRATTKKSSRVMQKLTVQGPTITYRARLLRRQQKKKKKTNASVVNGTREGEGEGKLEFYAEERKKRAIEKGGRWRVKG